MPKFNPKVSIIIPVYNGSNYLKEAIDSALAQTHKNIEVIVINDGSNDKGKTEKIAKSYGNKIRYFKKENGGVATALNLGIKKMTGEYFSWLSHDDLYYPDKIKKQIKFLEKLDNKEVILYGDYEYINQKGVFIEKINIPKRLKKIDIRLVFLKKLINSLSLLIPKEALIEEGLFDKNKKYTQDYDMWFRLIKKNYPFVYYNYCGCKTRLHLGQDSQNHQSSEEADVFWLQVIKEYDNLFKPLFPNEVNFILFMFLALKYSDHKKTKKVLEKELKKENLYLMLDVYENEKNTF